MYRSYWGLHFSPFENVPDPRFYYASPKHAEALSRMMYAVRARKGAAMLTGDIGTGKTTVARTMLRMLRESGRYRLCAIDNPSLKPKELVYEVIRQFGINGVVGDSKPEMLRVLHEIIDDTANEGKDTALIIDEAQAIRDVRTFEEIRLLLNLQREDRFLLTLVLVGQVELRARVRSIQQLAQRIAIHYHLSPLDFAETKKYIFHRLKMAGAKKNPFSDEALESIYQYTGGIPRKINNICDLSMLVASSQKDEHVTVKLVSRLLDDMRI